MVGYPLQEIRPGTYPSPPLFPRHQVWYLSLPPQLLNSGDHHRRPVQTCSLDLTSSVDQQNKYGRQTGGVCPIWMLSCQLCLNGIECEWQAAYPYMLYSYITCTSQVWWGIRQLYHSISYASHSVSFERCESLEILTRYEVTYTEAKLWSSQIRCSFPHFCQFALCIPSMWPTSTYPGWIKSPHVVTLGILKLTLGLGLSDNFQLVVVGGGYFGVNFGHPKSEVFRNGGGVFWSKLWWSQIWSFPKWGGGVFQSKLWWSQIWSFPKWWGGGYSGVNFGDPKSEVFQNGGGGVFRSKLWSSQIWSFPKWGGGGIPE